MLKSVLLADNGIKLGEIKGLGPLGFEGVEITKEGAFRLFNNVFSTIIGLLTVIAGIWFLFQVIVAGYQWLSSGGDKASIATARDKLTHALIGLVIVIMAFAIVSIVGTIMGIQFLRPATILESFPGLGGEE
jgi:uncharacterized membrane protein HdeD (DUF308 family)